MTTGGYPDTTCARCGYRLYWTTRRNEYRRREKGHGQKRIDCGNGNHIPRVMQQEAEQALATWAAEYARRDELVVAASAWLTKYRIHKITGIARTTLDRILADRS